MKTLLAPAALLLSAPWLAGTAAAPPPAPLAPAEIVARAAKGEWVAIAPADLLVMDLAPNARGKPRRVVIQLMPAPFSQGWIGNIRKLAAVHWWDGLSVNRVQDNYVAQWGDPLGEDTARAKPLPPGLPNVPQDDYALANYPAFLDWAPGDATGDKAAPPAPLGRRDPYAAFTTVWRGWPVAGNDQGLWPVHCYGMVGVGRDMPPDTGSGAELYVVIGHAPRHLDRNIALVGRVIEGIEHLSSLPRGTGALGFYETPAERTTIVSIRLGSAVAGLPTYEYLDTASGSFAAYADARANRRDAFFVSPAGGADVCNIPVPVRRAAKTG